MKERIEVLISNSRKMKFLVGFFYFSAIPELYRSLFQISHKLQEEDIQILIGLTVDKGIHGIYEISRKLSSNDKVSIDKIKEDLFNSLRIVFTHQDMDKKELYDQIDFFVKLLKERKIVIRKTRRPNHAKLYLFKMEDSVSQIIPNLFITGSSNLTRAGLESQDEFNVEIKDYGFSDAEQYFDRLWKESVEIGLEDVNRIVKIIENETFFRKISPFEAYVYVLKSYLDSFKGNELSKDIIHLLERKGYKVYDYQLDAVKQAVVSCHLHNGVLIADVVGLGKTVVACIVAKVLSKRGMVICPPHLIGDENKTAGWKKHLSDFELWDWEIRSLGKLPEALEFVKHNPDIQVIIVDEAHRFRNEETESYHYLREICRGKTVILLSATPFNNRPSDIFSLIKLFTIPKKSSIVFDENLKAKFDYYQDLFKKLSYIKNYHNSEEKSKNVQRIYQEIFNEGKESKVNINKVLKRSEELAKDIRNILEPVVIRRNRLDLKYYQQKIDLPEVKDPYEEFFELTPEQSEFYDEVIKSFDVIWEGGKFLGAAYLPIIYEKGLSINSLYEESIENQFSAEKDFRRCSSKSVFQEFVENRNPEDNFLFLYQKNLYNLMRRLLVKRFESSFGAFYQSIKRFKHFHQFALSFIEQTGKYVLDKRFLEQATHLESDEIEEKLLEYQKELESRKFSKYHKIYDIEQFKEKENFIRDIKHDLDLFGKLEEKMNKLRLNSIDPKIEKLKLKIREYLNKGVKVVIFTEYIDTAKYLFDNLTEFSKLIISAFGDLSKKTISSIYENFDAQYYKQEDSYSILIATDKLSEGFNLNRAGVVINYDIPWNPVRVIQRVGRINRIGKKVYDEIHIINFFPTEKGADIVRSREIASTKMFMIHKVLGEDSKIFAPDEEPEPSLLYKKINEYKEEEEENFMTKIKKEYDRLKFENPEIVNRITNFPPRVKVSKPGEKNEMIVFIRRNKDIFIGYKDYSSSNPLIVSFEDVFNKIKCDPDTPSLGLSQQFWENYKIILDKSYYTSIYGGRSKALWVLETILKGWDQFGLEQNYRQFIIQIIEDIRDFGTISEYVLSKIVSWEQIIKNKPMELRHLLSEIYDVLGSDFLEKIKKLQRESEEDVIVAIENVLQN